MMPLRLESVVLGPGTRPLAARDRALPPRGVRMVSFLLSIVEPRQAPPTH